MYIPPGFTLIACEKVDESALQSWAMLNGGVWHLATEGWNGSRWPACAKWDLGPVQQMEAKFGALSDKETEEWTPRMHKPPRSTVDVELSESLADKGEMCAGVLQALFKQWDCYAYDLGFHDWVSELLRDLLPTERIIRREPPPPVPPSAWVWVNGIYKKRE